MLIRFLAIFVVMFAFVGVAKADVASDLELFWNSLSSGSNVTGASSFKGQAASYYTFGNARYRAQNRTTQLTTFSLPSVEAGCGGIDLIGGGFSVVSTDEVVMLARSIIQNAQGFAFELAIETVSPVIAETMKSLRALAQELNLNSINSCETAKGLVSSIWPKQEVIRDKVCAELGVSRGVFATYAESRHECGSTPKQKQTKDATAKPEEAKEPKEFVGPINIAWDVLRGADYQSADWLKNDVKLAEFMMSMIGTIIITDKPGGGEDIAYFRPLALIDPEDKKTWLNYIVFGDDANEINIYRCASSDTEKCLEVSSTPSSNDADKSIHHYVLTMLDGLVKKIRSNSSTETTAAERGFVNATRLPVYRFLNVYAAYSGDLVDIEMRVLAEILAIDLGLEWFEGIVREVDARARVSNMAGNDVFTQWKDNLDTLLEDIKNIKVENHHKYNRALGLVDRVSQLEEILGQNISRSIAHTSRRSSGTGQ